MNFTLIVTVSFFVTGQPMQHWNGAEESYQVKYRTCGKEVFLNYVDRILTNVNSPSVLSVGIHIHKLQFDTSDAVEF